MRSARPILFLFGLVGAVSLSMFAASCSSSSTDAPTTQDAGTDEGVDTLPPPRDTAPKADTGSSTDTGPGDPLAGCTKDPIPASETTVPAGAGGGDPLAGTTFTLDQAMEGFPAGTGTLTAAITTEKGLIVCKLDETHAPISVANFVGLARGTRPAQKGGSEWTKSHFYDGLLWHRVVADFVIQGGDPLGTGTGGPGYDLPTENQVAEPEGTLAMAAAAVPSGSQFYIVIGSGPAAKYNVFGSCATDTGAKLIEQKKDHMQKVEILRCPAK